MKHFFLFSFNISKTFPVLDTTIIFLSAILGCAIKWKL